MFNVGTYHSYTINNVTQQIYRDDQNVHINIKSHNWIDEEGFL